MVDDDTNKKIIEEEIRSPQKKQKSRQKTSWIILLAIIAAVVIFIVFTVLSKISQARYSNSSRYNYEAKISDDGSDLSNEEMAGIWINGYLSQYKEMFTPQSSKLKSIKVESVEEADAEAGTVKMVFSAQLVDSSNQYFNDWGGYISGGTLRCSWTGAFGVKNTGNGYVVYPLSISDNSDNSGGQTVDDDDDDQSMVQYQISDNNLSVSFNGGVTYSQVPIDIRNLPLTGDNYDTLSKGSYVLNDNIAAFLYGGETVNGERVPFLIIYSADSGSTWETGEVDSIYDIDSYHIDMVSENEGVIVVGYGINNNSEYTKIYSTTDSCKTWTNVGSGPNTDMLSGSKFIDINTGFIAYKNDSGNNLYMTRDGGKTFNVVSLPEGTLDETASGKKWSDIFKIASVPKVDDEGNLVVYLSQPSGSKYHNGVSVMYRSTDNGITWNIVEEIML